MQNLLALILVLCAGCAAQMKSTVTETSMVAGKPVTTTMKSETQCQGLGCTAHEIANLEIRRQQVADQGDVGRAAIAQGMPTQLGHDGVQAGYTYGYGAYGTYGANPYGASSAILAAEAASLGHLPGRLPRLGEAPVYVQPSQPQVGGPARCPEDRKPSTEAERISCLERDRDTFRKRVYGK